jgi:hypothetical protein
MPKFRTFGIKVPKQTRSREIPDDKKIGYRAPLTSSVMTRHLDFKIQEVPKDTQVSRLARSKKKAEKHLRNLIQKRQRFPEQADYYELQIKRTQEHIFNKEMKISLLNRDLDIRDKRRDTQKENERLAEENRKKNLAKAEKFLGPVKPVSGANSNIISKIDAREKAEALFLSREKIVSNAKGGRTVKKNRHKTWSRI